MPKAINSFKIYPSIPEKLLPLKELAYNLYWSWNMDCYEIFQRLDSDLWEETHHNPVLMLGTISQQKLLEAANDDGFVLHLYRVYNDFQTYMMENTWFNKTHDRLGNSVIAYFSMEYGLTDCLQIYSGGLGVLSGDHLKSSSELGIPLVGVGLAYSEGYFQQYLNSEGWQLETYPMNDFYNLPMTLVTDKNNQPLLVEVNFPAGVVYCQIWKIQVGRIPLFLLDTNTSKNSDEYRKITYGLYRGGGETRIQQEIILGIGGIRALIALGYFPKVCHMNEGHSAFLALERIKLLINEYKLSFKEAFQIGFRTNIFTTHTPVPAGIDIFSREVIEKYFNDYRNSLGLSNQEFFDLGRLNKTSDDSFNMAHLAMNMSGYVNGVSKLHSKVSKKMWVSGWKDIPFEEIPIDSITNGVHIRSHISHDIETLFTRYLGESWILNPNDDSVWDKIDKIPDIELWRTHERRRERLVSFARRNLEKQLRNQGATASEIQKAYEVLEPSTLTIGFARRFATYKRATLILKNMDRLIRILNNPDRPVQIIFAGKAHPQDDAGKQFIKEIKLASKNPELKNKIVFLENYDMNMARYLVQGCDIWLNTPRRPLEASGTSGMKVLPNGGLNFSILDGWWDEGFSPEVGWAIGKGEEFSDHKYQDEVEANQIYDILEFDIAPLFYKRGNDGIPREWIAMMKRSMKSLIPKFNSNRMVREYLDKFYIPAIKNYDKLKKDNWIKIKDLVAWEEKINRNWSKISIYDIQSEISSEIKVGDSVEISAKVFLGEIEPSDVSVEIYYGRLNGSEILQNGKISKMKVTEDYKDGNYLFKGSFVSKISGRMGYTIRILPNNSLMINPMETKLIKWAQ